MKHLIRPFIVSSSLLCGLSLVAGAVACNADPPRGRAPATKAGAEARVEAEVRAEAETKAAAPGDRAPGDGSPGDGSPGAGPSAAPTPTGFPLQVEDRATVALTIDIVQRHDKPALQLSYDGKALSEYGHSIENRMNRLTEYDIQVSDFEHEGQRYRTSVLSVNPDGSLQPWAREDETCISPKVRRPLRDTVHVSFVVVAVRGDGRQILADPYPDIFTPPMDPPPSNPSMSDRGDGSAGDGTGGRAQDDSAADDTSGGA